LALMQRAVMNAPAPAPATDLNTIYGMLEDDAPVWVTAQLIVFPSLYELCNCLHCFAIIALH
ncbi:hypothetical protein U1Q18_036354, partial [Sarracenia purpurea var. burkii]